MYLRTMNKPAKESVSACVGYCNDRISLMMNDIFSLDAYARSRFQPLAFSPYDDAFVFRKCISLLTSIALQVRLLIDTGLVKTERKDELNIEGHVIHKQSIDIFDFMRKHSEHEMNSPDWVSCFSYFLNVGEVVTAEQQTPINLKDACGFIGHPNKAWFCPKTENCVSSVIAIELDRRSRDPQYEDHHIPGYDNRIYKICLTRFAYTAFHLFNFCPDCSGQNGTVDIDQKGIPDWESFSEMDSIVIE